jgi:hypothetical protein
MKNLYLQKSIILYQLNFTLLIIHEIESAFWKEWELFGIYGGLEVFLLFNFLLVLFFIYGFVKFLQRRKAGIIFSLMLSLSGIIAFAIHGIFILAGNKEFTLPISIVILISTFFISIIQAFYTITLINRNKIDLG